MVGGHGIISTRVGGKGGVSFGSWLSGTGHDLLTTPDSNNLSGVSPWPVDVYVLLLTLTPIPPPTTSTAFRSISVSTLFTSLHKTTDPTCCPIDPDNRFS